MAFIQSANILLRFLLELAALTALAYWGFQTGTGLGLKWLMAIGAPLAAAVIWGFFGSPRAPYPLHGFDRIMFELLFFGAAAGALFFTRTYTVACAYSLLTLANLYLLHFWKQ